MWSTVNYIIYENNRWNRSARDIVETSKTLLIYESLVATVQEIISEIVYFNGGKSWPGDKLRNVRCCFVQLGRWIIRVTRPRGKNLTGYCYLVSRKFVIDFERRIASRRDKLKSPSPRCADNAITTSLDDSLWLWCVRAGVFAIEDRLTITLRLNFIFPDDCLRILHQEFSQRSQSVIWHERNRNH